MENKDLRIVQIIDSLEAGGAERMAVNYANALEPEIGFSGLVATRKEGALVEQLAAGVSYLFLDRKKTFDIVALLRLRNFVVRNRVNVVHAHSSSFMLAVMLKLICPKIKIIWHDHYGNSEFLEKRESKALRLASRFFSGEIAVNRKLLDWGMAQLSCKKIIYFPNFVIADNLKDTRKETTLSGEEEKRIVCLANLRPQKGHFFLLEIATKIKTLHPDWTFHLVGKDFADDYSDAVKSKIITLGLERTVFVYGSRNDIANVLRQSSIGILTSLSEGLPVSLLEYGLFGLPVVATNVGEIPDIIHSGQGIITDKNDTDGFTAALVSLIENKALRQQYGKALNSLIYTTFVQNVVIEKYLNWIRSL